MVIDNPYYTDEQIRAMIPNTWCTEYSGTFLNEKEYKKILKKHKWIKRVDKVNRRYLRLKAKVIKRLELDRLSVSTSFYKLDLTEIPEGVDNEN